MERLTIKTIGRTFGIVVLEPGVRQIDLIEAMRLGQLYFDAEKPVTAPHSLITPAAAGTTLPANTEQLEPAATTTLPITPPSAPQRSAPQEIMPTPRRAKPS